MGYNITNLKPGTKYKLTFMVTSSHPFPLLSNRANVLEIEVTTLRSEGVLEEVEESSSDGSLWNFSWIVLFWALCFGDLI